MIDLKEKIYQALHSVCENLSDTYPTDWTKLPCIQYMEDENKVESWTDDIEKISFVRYRIEIWSDISTSQIALDVDRKLAALGLKRAFSQDIDDPTHLKHKVMRYEALLEEINGELYVYHKN